MVSNFSDWINKELNKRNWKQADLVRRGVDSGYLSKVITGTREPGLNFLLQLSEALSLPKETVFRAAGILPPKPETDVLDEELHYLFDQLTPEDQEELLEFARLKFERKKKTQKPTEANGRRSVGS